MRGRVWIKVVIVLAVGTGLFALGHLTARGYDDGHAAGLREGQVQGRQEGRALQQAQAAPAASRNAVAAAFRDGYAAGANDVFVGYDGGWGLGTPYVVTLGRGGGAVTYRIDSRTPMHAGVDYYLCPGAQRVCQAPR